VIPSVSDAVKEVLQMAGSKQDRKLALPALAGAEHVYDKDLVLEYRESFEAIHDGVHRAGSPSPSAVVLVVWRGMHNIREFEAAVAGLSRALYKHLPEWRIQLSRACPRIGPLRSVWAT